MEDDILGVKSSGVEMFKLIASYYLFLKSLRLSFSKSYSAFMKKVDAAVEFLKKLFHAVFNFSYPWGS